MTVRRAEAGDATPLLHMMRALALCEGYLAQFRVTEADLLERGLDARAGTTTAQFCAFVAEHGAGLLGYALVYTIPFTFDLRPTLVLKELYVRADTRGAGCGRALMQAVLAYARASGCARLKWDVLPDNARAQGFYRSLGGAPDSGWENWLMPITPV